MIEPAAFALAWLVTWLVHSTVLAAAAWLLDRPALVRAPAARELLWRAALFGALLTATFQSAGLVERVSLRALLSAPFSGVATAEPLRAPATAPAAAPAAASARSAAAVAHAPDTASAAVKALPAADVAKLSAPTVAAPDADAPAPMAGASAPATAPAGASPASWSFAAFTEDGAVTLLLVWGAGAVLLVLRLCALGRLARRELAARRPADGALAAEFRALCATLGVTAPRLSVAPALAGPISLPNGEIVVPGWMLASLPARQRRAMLAHELAHQVRRDPRWLAGALGLHALLWVQPLFGLARRRLVALAEIQADAWAARAVDDPRALAQCLAVCAERLQPDRVALFGAAMTRGSLLVERVERLLGGTVMQLQTTSWPLRGAVVAALCAATYLLPGCDLQTLDIATSGASTSVSISDDGDATVTSKRPGYSLHMETDGELTFAEDESDVATLEPKSTFTLIEKLDGVKREYTVTADGAGVLTRSYVRDGEARPMDDEARQWVAAALPRMFRESGYDAEARVTRLLASGGPERVLAEVDAARSDYARGAYLGRLLGSVALDDAQLARAFQSAAAIESDYELRGALMRAFETQSLDAARLTQLLQAAGGIDSNYELAELLCAAAPRLGDDTSARAAWLAAARRLDSDYELGRTLQAGLERPATDAAFTAEVVALATERMDGDYSLGEVLKQVAPRAGDPALAAAYLSAAATLDGDYDCRTALVTLLESATLDAANLSLLLDTTAGIDSDFERSTVLKALAPSVAADPELNRRYRKVASSMGDYERGIALLALDDATPR